MAPEQFVSRNESTSADQYALGVIAFEYLSGTLPFVGDSYEEVARLHQDDDPARLTDLCEDIPILIADAVEQALRKRASDRFANVLDFVTVLRGGPPRGAEHLAPMEEPRGAPQVLTIGAPRRRIPLMYLLVGGAAATLSLVVFLVSMSGGGGEGAAVTGESQSARAALPEAPPVVVTERAPPPSPRPTPAAETRTTPVETAPAEVPARRPATRPARRVSSARLFLNTRPWGVLFVDGEELGNTPKANLALAPGVHVIRVERDGYEPYEIEIEVAGGEEVRMTDIVLKPRQP
jgi:serine/threonine-protein kinase